MRAKWARWFAECGKSVSESVKIEIDPVTANDAASLKVYLTANDVDISKDINI